MLKTILRLFDQINTNFTKNKIIKYSALVHLNVIYSIFFQKMFFLNIIFFRPVIRGKCRLVLDNGGLVCSGYSLYKHRMNILHIFRKFQKNFNLHLHLFPLYILKLKIFLIFKFNINACTVAKYYTNLLNTFK